MGAKKVKTKKVNKSKVQLDKHLKKVKHSEKDAKKKIFDKVAPVSLIDALHKSLLSIGIEVNREGWRENENSSPPNDNCEWLDASLPDKDGNIYTVHFYFTNDSKVLGSLQIFKSEVKKTYTTPTCIAGEYSCDNDKKHSSIRK